MSVTPSSAAQLALESFVARAVKHQPSNCFNQPFDEEWRSQCEFKQEADQTFWRPVPQTEPLDFSGLANAAEAPIHPDIQTYYSQYWAGTLLGKTEEGEVSLIQVWNPDDFTRLLENLVGHLFHKILAKQAFTVFFANTEEDSELFLSIDNSTGAILLEEPGRPPIREVAPNLADFLNRIEPDIREASIY